MDKWGWTAPLDSHLFTAYDEYQALTILQALFPNRYANIIRVDKPDLQDEQLGIGIEVTQAYTNKSNHMDGELTKYFHETDNQIKGTIRDKLIDMGGSFDEYDTFYWPAEINGFDAVIYEFKRKLQKLNSGQYAPFAHNKLFVFSGIYAFDDMLQQALKDMKNIQMDFIVRFETVYVYVPEHLYIFDLQEDDCKSQKIDKENQTAWACRAREKAECDGNE